MTEWVYVGFNTVRTGTGTESRWTEKHLWKCPLCGYVAKTDMILRPVENCPGCEKEAREKTE